MRVAVLSLVALAAVVVGTGALFRITPTGFLPAEDQGAFFAQIALPEGASVNRTQEVVRQAEQIMSETPGIIGVTSITGLNFLNDLAQSNSAFMVMTLAPFEERLDPRARGRGDHPRASSPSSRRSPAPPRSPSTCRRSSASAAPAASSTSCRT